MTTYVIDASVAIKWVVEETGTQQALLLRRHRLLAPDLLIPECADVLWKKVRRGELTEDEAMVAAGLLHGADIALSPMSGLLEPATRLAILLVHSAHDCFYLALAHQNNCAFVTADEAFARKVSAAGIPVAVTDLRDIRPE